jgi:hypothetical protein
VSRAARLNAQQSLSKRVCLHLAEARCERVAALCEIGTPGAQARHFDCELKPFCFADRAPWD